MCFSLQSSRQTEQSRRLSVRTIASQPCSLTWFAAPSSSGELIRRSAILHNTAAIAVLCNSVKCCAVLLIRQYHCQEPSALFACKRVTLQRLRGGFTGLCRSAAELLAWLENFEELATVDPMWDSDDPAGVNPSNRQSIGLSQYEMWPANKLNRVVHSAPSEAFSEVPIHDLSPRRTVQNSLLLCLLLCFSKSEIDRNLSLDSKIITKI